MKRQKYYTIYKTTNLINKREYIGQHVAYNLNDNYIGSGSLLSNAIKKYGKHNFKKEILHIFDTFDEMNQKEIELVNHDYVLRDDTYNVTLGGSKWNTKNSIVVRNKITGIVSRIQSINFDNDVHEAITKGKLVVRLIGTNKNIQIKCSDFDNNIHEHVSKNKIVVRDIQTNKTLSIHKDNFDRSKYKSVFGGIVATKDGKNCYVTRDEYDQNELRVKSFGKVVVIDSIDNTVKQIDKNEYHLNKNRYTTPSTGYVTIKDKITNETKRIHRNDITPEIKDRYFLSTGGQVTVFDKILNKYTNITVEEFQANRDKYSATTTNKVIVFDITKKDLKFHAIQQNEYNHEIHKRPNDIKIKLLNSFNEVVFTYWGSKRNIEQHLFKLLKIKVTKTVRLKFFKGELFLDNTSTLFNYKIVYIDWKNENELSRKA